MDSRISVILNDKSARTSPVVGVTGATVIEALKGPTKPVLIERGSTNRILSIFGTPTSTNPQVWDVIEYNQSYPIWVSAPSTGGTYGSVLVTKAGTKNGDTATGDDATLVGLTSKTIDFSAIRVKQTLTSQSTTKWTGTMNAYFGTYTAGRYNPLSIRVYKNGVQLTTGGTPVVLDTGYEEIAGTGLTTGDASNPTTTSTLNTSTGAINIIFNPAISTSDVITVEYTSDMSEDAYFCLISKNTQADDLAVMVEKNYVFDPSVGDDYFTTFDINLYLKDTVNASYSQLGSAVSVGLKETSKDGFGRFIYGPTVFQNSDYIDMVVNTDLAAGQILDGDFEEDTTRVDFFGGYRGTTDASDIVGVYTSYFNAYPNEYAADVFFDCTGEATVHTIMETCRNSYQKYSTFLGTLGDGSSSTLIEARGTISNRGFKYYGGLAEVLNPYAAGSFASTLMGRVARNHADMFVQFNGLQVSDVNENGLGGQLGGGIVRMFTDYSETDIIALEGAQINPIIRHPFYGVMVMRDRTSLQGALTDYSYGGHSRLADYLIKNIVQILVPQLSKPNDDGHRYLVSSRANAIIGPLLSSPYTLLRDALVICDSTNNTDEVLSRGEFALDVFIKFTPFSNFIKFYFTNVDQTTNISEVVGA